MQTNKGYLDVKNVLTVYFLPSFCFSYIVTALILYSAELRPPSFITASQLLLSSSLVVSLTFSCWLIKRCSASKKPPGLSLMVASVAPPVFLCTIILLLTGEMLHLTQNLFLAIQNSLIFLLIYSGFLTIYLQRDSFCIENKPNKKILDVEKMARSIDCVHIYQTVFKKPLPTPSITLRTYKKILTALTLFSIAILGLFLRLHHASALLFWIDESTSMLVARRIANGLGQTMMNELFYPRGIIYHHYIATLMRLSSQNIYYIGRLANVPFFLMIFYTTYIFGKYIANRACGVIASIIFCFSWISISIFREARFYEMWLAFFLIFAILVYVLIEKYFNEKENSTVVFFKKNAFTILITGFFGIVSYDCQELTAFILYPLIIFGITVFLFQGRIKGLMISASSFVLLFIALFYKYKFSVVEHLIIQSGPQWKSLYPATPIFGPWDFALHNDYRYLSLFILLAAINLVIFRKDIKLIFLNTFIITWYFIIAYQGYEVNMIRYYYPILPFLALSIAYNILIITAAIKRSKIDTALFSIVIISLMIYTLLSGIKESESVLKNNSKNSLKNDNLSQEIAFIQAKMDIKNATVITNNIWGAPFYLYFHRLPDYIVLDTSVTNPDEGGIEPMTGQKEIDFLEISRLQKPIYVIFNYPSQRVSAEAFNMMNRIGNEIYRNKNIRIYLVEKIMNRERILCPSVDHLP